MPFKSGKLQFNERVMTKRQKTYVKKHWSKMTNRQLADALGVGLTWLRMRLYEMGMKRMELEYWTDAQVNYLRKHYRKKGDLELATIFNQRWPKDKGWTLKHIEKKRMYLKLKRTKQEVAKIKAGHVANGCYILGSQKTWATRGVTPEGEIRYWKTYLGHPFPHIKIGNRFQRWNQWMWRQHNGPIPREMNVVFKPGIDPGDPKSLDIKNLMLVTNAGLARLNSQKSSIGLSDNYVAAIMSIKDKRLRKRLLQNKELLNLKRNQLLLNRQINGTAIQENPNRNGRKGVCVR